MYSKYTYMSNIFSREGEEREGKGCEGKEIGDRRDGRGMRGK